MFKSNENVTQTRSWITWRKWNIVLQPTAPLSREDTEGRHWGDYPTRIRSGPSEGRPRDAPSRSSQMFPVRLNRESGALGPHSHQESNNLAVKSRQIACAA